MVKLNGIFGFDNGIVLAPMGPDVAGPELVAAVANSGGLGLLATPSSGYDIAVKFIQATKKLTSKPFGAGVLLEWDPSQGVKAIFDENLAVIQVYWGDYPKEMVDEAHRHGVKVLHQVGTIERAEKAVAAGVDGIIAQGFEAGGHIEGTTPLVQFVPQVVNLVRKSGKNIVVIAAGGISDAKGYASALTMGAQGVCMGTRFIATEEAYAARYYKEQLVKYKGNQTESTLLWGRASWVAPVRCLTTPFYLKWRNVPETVKNDKSQPIVGYTTIYGNTSEMRRLDGRAPNPTTVGNLEDMCYLAGTGVGLIEEILPVSVLISKIVEETNAIVNGLPADTADQADDLRQPAQQVQDQKGPGSDGRAPAQQDHKSHGSQGRGPPGLQDKKDHGPPGLQNQKGNGPHGNMGHGPPENNFRK